MPVQAPALPSAYEARSPPCMLLAPTSKIQLRCLFGDVFIYLPWENSHPLLSTPTAHPLLSTPTALLHISPATLHFFLLKYDPSCCNSNTISSPWSTQLELTSSFCAVIGLTLYIYYVLLCYGVIFPFVLSPSLYYKLPKDKDYLLHSVCCCSVAQSCTTHCNPMDCSSTPGFPTLHYLPESAQTHIHCWQCHPTISSSVALFFSCPAGALSPSLALFISNAS